MSNLPAKASDNDVINQLSEASVNVKNSINGAIESVEKTVEKVYPEVQNWAKNADKKLHDGVDGLRHAGEKAQNSVKSYAHSIESYVGKKPIQSAFIAAAAGAVFASLVFKSRRRK